jgi:hypothetical protein
MSKDITVAARELAEKREQEVRSERRMHWFARVPLAIVLIAIPLAMTVYGYRSDDYDAGVLFIGGLLCLLMIIPLCGMLVFDDKKRHAVNEREGEAKEAEKTPRGVFWVAGVLVALAVFAGYKAVTGYTEQTAREAALLACPAYIEKRCANDDEYGIKQCIEFLSQFGDEDYSMCPGLGSDGLPFSTKPARFTVEN